VISTDYEWTQIVTSYGFDAPRYRWYLNGVLITESPLSYQPLTLGIEVFIPPDPTVFDAKVSKAIMVNLTYRLSGNRLDLRLAGCPGNLTLAVRVVIERTFRARRGKGSGRAPARERQLCAPPSRRLWAHAVVILPSHSPPAGMDAC